MPQSVIISNILQFLLVYDLIVIYYLVPYLLIFISIILIVTLGSVIGMILNRNLLLKFFLCFESFFFIMSVIIMIWSCKCNGIIIILYLLWNSTFEIILGLTMLFIIYYSFIIESSLCSTAFKSLN